MKHISKRLVSLILAVAVVLGMAIPMASAAPTAPLGNAAWTSIGGTIKCYTIKNQNYTTYTSKELTTRSGYVDGADEITVLIISTNSRGNWYAQINYKVNSGGTKEAYIPLSAFCTDTSVQAGVEKRARIDINVYRRPGVSYGGNSYIGAGDDVYVIGKSGSYTQVMYPTGHQGRNPGLESNAWKFAWIKTTDARNYLVSRQKGASWSDTFYGYSNTAGTTRTTIGKAGCGLLSIVNAVYHLNGEMIAPEFLARFSLDNGCRENGVGTNGPKLVKLFCNSYGNTYHIKHDPDNDRADGDHTKLKNCLQNGCVAIAGVSNGNKGHLIAIVEYNSSNNTFLIFDSDDNMPCGSWVSEYTLYNTYWGDGVGSPVLIIRKR